MFDWLRPRRSYLFLFYSLLALWWLFSLGPAGSRCSGPWLATRCFEVHPFRYLVVPLAGAVLCYPLAIALTRFLPVEEWSNGSHLVYRLFHPTNGETMILVAIALIYSSVEIILLLPNRAPEWLGTLAYDSQFFFKTPLVFPLIWYNLHNSDFITVTPFWGWIHLPFIGLWHFLLARAIAAIPSRLVG